MGFKLIYETQKQLLITHAAFISLGPYLCFLLNKQLNVGLLCSIIMSIALVINISLLIESLIYKPLRNKNSKGYIILVASIGLYIVIINLINLLWGNITQTIRSENVCVGHGLLGAYITNIQIIMVITNIIIYGLLVTIISKTKFGLLLHALSSNDELSVVFGLNKDKIILFSTAIGSGIAALAGILVALDTDINVSMGFSLLFYAIVSLIIGGIGHKFSVLFGALALSSAQHLCSFFINNVWMDAIAYIILILFLIWKPLGFSGKRLKKTEI